MRPRSISSPLRSELFRVRSSRPTARLRQPSTHCSQPINRQNTTRLAVAMVVPEAPEVLAVPEAQADLAAERSSQREARRRARLQPFAFMQELPVLIFQNDFRDA